MYAPIETGEITMQITDYIGDAWYVSKVAYIVVLNNVEDLSDTRQGGGPRGSE